MPPLPRRRARRKNIPHYCRMCGEKIEREPGKRGAPPAYCANCEPIGKREYMRNYMRDYRSTGRRVHPPAAAGGVEVERLDDQEAP